MKRLCHSIPFLALLSAACAPIELPYTSVPLIRHFQGQDPFEIGVNAHLDTLPNLKRVSELGARWVRMDLNWDSIEARPGQWDFSAPDASVRDALSLNLQVYATLAYSPAWASGAGGRTDVPRRKDWKNFVRQCARRYCGQIAVFGVWNEPNLEEFFSGSAEDYVEVLLKPAWEAVHEEAPGSLVAGPELAHLYSARLGIQEFLDTIGRLGAGHYLDIVSHHVYGADDYSQKLTGFWAGEYLYKAGLIQMLKHANLEEKEVWITETGAELRQGDELAQAQLLLRQIGLLGSQRWIRKAFIYQLRDDDPQEPSWGLMRPDRSLRPAYYDLRSWIHHQDRSSQGLSAPLAAGP